MRRRLLLVVALLAVGLLIWAASGRSWLVAQHRFWMAARRGAAGVTVVEVGGVGPIPMFLNPDDRIVSSSLWVFRSWELNESAWFIKSLRPGDVVVDVGANVGYYTLLGAKLVGETGRVYAFEPDPVSFEILERNVRLNGFDNVILERKAVSNEPGTIQLYLATTNLGDHRIYPVKGEKRDSIDVEAVTLDDYFEGVEDAVDFVKVDAQGAEGVILEGMVGLIERSPELVMAFEYSPNALQQMGSSADRLLATFERLGLSMFELGPGGFIVPPRLNAVSASELRQRFSPQSQTFTNLLLVKGRPDLLERIQRPRAARGARETPP